MANVIADLVQIAKRMGRAALTKDGAEVPDPAPLEVPLGFERPESIQETIRRLVTDPALRAELQNQGVETFDDADDFEVEDDIPVQSPYEENFDPLHLTAREQELRAGAVAPRTPEELKAAADAIERIRKQHAKTEAVKA